MERERSGERTKLAAQISLKGDASLLTLPKSWNQYKTNQICSRVPEMVVPVKRHYV